jgi:hypothetical protein
VHLVAYRAISDAVDRLAPLGTAPAVLVPAERYRLLEDLEVAAERAAWFDADVVVGAGAELVAVGPASALVALLQGEVLEAGLDEGRVLFHQLDGPDPDLLDVADRVVHLPTGGEPVILVGPSAGLAGPCGPRADADRWRQALSWSAAGVPVAAAPAAEILTMPLWSPARCRALVTLAEAAGADEIVWRQPFPGPGRWAADPDDPVPGSELPLLALSPALFAAVAAEVDERVVPALRAHWPTFAWCGLDDAFVIRTAPAIEAADPLDLHHDVAQISASLVLSADHRGGGIEFPRQGWSTAACPVGELVVWPSLVTHPHRGLPVISGVRYGLTLWFSLPG